MIVDLVGHHMVSLWQIQFSIIYTRGFQPGVRGPLVVCEGIAGGPLISSPLTFFIFYKFPSVFQHISRLLLNIMKNI